MQTPVRIAFHNMKPSDAVAAMIEEKAGRMERYFDRITGCAVTLVGPGRHHRHGRHYRVRVELQVPGERLVVGRDPAKTRSHEDLYAAVNAAFREVRRQLRDHVRRFDARVKVRTEPARGKVTRLFLEDGYGFLATSDGREVYFNERSVLEGAFPRLRVGSAVRFAEEKGEEGPQASTVAVARRERRAPRRAGLL
jgi:ribosomal subunit interface protein